MKIAIIGSRNIGEIDLDKYVVHCDEIITGGARGVDTCAEEYANEHGIKVTVITPDYNRYGRGAPIVRNKEIVDLSDKVLAFWDGSSRGTLSVINYARKTEKPCEVILCEAAKKAEEQ